MQPNKLTRLLQSRKFWASIIGLLMAFGLYTGTDLDAERLVDAIQIIVGTFTLGTGIESGLQALANQRS